jgi:hypothetical protein
MQASSGVRARSAVAIILAVAAVLLAIPVGISLLTHREPKLTPESLASSVQNDAGWAEAGCVRVEGVHWRCNVSEASDGGGVYDVRMTSDHCWRARAIEQHGTFEPLTASGCL